MKTTKSFDWSSKKKTDSLKISAASMYDYLVDAVGDDTDYFALNYFGNRITYSKMFRTINLLSKCLKESGIKKGDIVTVCLPNMPVAVELFYAINKIGAVVDMVHPLSSPAELKNFLQKNHSHILFLYDANYEKISKIISSTDVNKVILISVSEDMPKLTKTIYNLTKGLRLLKSPKEDATYIMWKDFVNLGYSVRNFKSPKISKDDIAVILHSGGTTGTPKGIMLTNYNFNALAVQGAVNVQNVEAKDKILTILPLFHGFGLGVCVHCPLTLKVEVILHPEFTPKSFASILKKYTPQVLAGVPTLFESMLANPIFSKIDLSSLKYMISGGDNLPVELEHKINSFLQRHSAQIKLTKGYGMTESLAATIFTFPDSNKPGSIGTPMLGNTVRICRLGTNEEVYAKTVGEICVHGPTIMKGYYDEEKETAKILHLHDDKKIYLHTGDLGYEDERGLIYFTGRLKRLIVSSGFNIYPAQIEEVLMKHKNVSSCCVIGIPHPYKMQVAKAYVVLKDGRPTDKLRAELRLLCKEELASYSQPKEYEFVESLPKTIYNKTDYKKLEEEEKRKYEERKK